jgi:hypothetical protein
MIDTEYRRHVVSHLRDLVAAAERIALALERANANDPIDAINRALGGHPLGDETPVETEPPSPEALIHRRRVGDLAADLARRIGEIPDDEQWRLR